MTRAALVLLVLPLVAQAQEAPSWVVAPGRVGEVVVGRPLPRALRGPEGGGEDFLGYVADGRPVEGVQWRDPPLQVRLRTGPFLRKAARVFHPAPEADSYRARAWKEIRKGIPVLEIVVTGPGPATAEGHGVGSTLTDLRRTWPDLVPHPVPPSQGQDECVAGPPSLPGVWFYFRSCREAEEGDPVVRVEVHAPPPPRGKGSRGRP